MRSNAFQCIAQPNTTLVWLHVYIVSNANTIPLWSRHFTRLCRSVHPWERVSEIQSIKEIPLHNLDHISTACTLLCQSRIHREIVYKQARAPFSSSRTATTQLSAKVTVWPRRQWRKTQAQKTVLETHHTPTHTLSCYIKETRFNNSSCSNWAIPLSNSQTSICCTFCTCCCKACSLFLSCKMPARTLCMVWMLSGCMLTVALE